MDKQDYATSDLTADKNWVWKTKQTPEMLLQNIKLVIPSWENLSLDDIEI